MNFYKVEVDSNATGWLLPNVPEIDILNYCIFDCSPRINNWPLIEWSIFDDSRPKADFYTIGNSGAFAFTKKVFESNLTDFLLSAGELLPLSVNGEIMHLFNATICLPEIQLLKKDINIVSTDIFKTYDMLKTRIVTVDFQDDRPSFYNSYKTANLTGLLFDII